jgi:uncharacterized protein YcaQ
MTTLTNSQARKFILLKQGLIGEYKFTGKQGALEFVRQAGCVQYDPVDVCGRNADISLLSRVKGYKKEMLDELLYKDRRLLDFFDKNLSIFPVEDAPAFYKHRMYGGYAEMYDSLGGEAVQNILPMIRKLIEERGHISAKEIDVDETIVWDWGSMSSLPRAALESMYFRGELIVHHKTGTNKSYAFAKDHIPAEILNAGLPYKTDEERFAWHFRRRIGAVGMLWNKNSDAWLGLPYKVPERAGAFKKMLDEGTIYEFDIDGLNGPFYCHIEDKPLVEKAAEDPELKPRCEFIAPLDSFIWDRKLIKALFGFEYGWEIYTPAVQRKYGAYVLPILYGESFIGRIEAVREIKTKTLNVRNIWYEDGVKQTKKLQAALNGCLKRFAEFNGCDNIQ